MAEMALFACPFSACVNCTRDGKNPEDDIAEKKWQAMVIILRVRMVRMIILKNRERLAMVRENSSGRWT
jgi:hypothetical protein